MTTQRFQTEAAVVRVGEGLLDCALPRPEWTHAAHFAAAVYLVCRRPAGAAERDMPDIIRAYNLATGVENSDTAGYHETITQASLQVVRRVLLRQSSSAPLHDRTNAVLDAGYAQKDWLLRHWRRETLFSIVARRVWVDPDLARLP